MRRKREEEVKQFHYPSRSDDVSIANRITYRNRPPTMRQSDHVSPMANHAAMTNKKSIYLTVVLM